MRCIPTHFSQKLRYFKIRCRDASRLLLSLLLLFVYFLALPSLPKYFNLFSCFLYFYIYTSLPQCIFMLQVPDSLRLKLAQVALCLNLQIQGFCVDDDVHICHQSALHYHVVKYISNNRHYQCISLHGSEGQNDIQFPIYCHQSYARQYLIPIVDPIIGATLIHHQTCKAEHHSLSRQHITLLLRRVQ